MRGTGDGIDGFGTTFTGSVCTRSGVGGRGRGEEGGGVGGGGTVVDASGGAPGGAVGTLAAAFFTSLFDDFSAPDAFSMG